MDIAGLVRAVIKAFDDAAKLVNRIRDQKANSEGSALPEEPTRELLESLTLGPVIVRGHYDHDLKRFGEQYACGDIQAREQLKDVLINLQMTLIQTLTSVWMDDAQLDFSALQSASDDCRVNAGVCLGQLSQRLSESAKAHAMYAHNMGGFSTGSSQLPLMSPSLAYSSSRSTESSRTFGPPRTPDLISEQFANMNVTSAARPPYGERKMSSGSGGSQSPYSRRPPALLQSDAYLGVPNVGVHRVDESDEHSIRRRSSHTLALEDSLLLAPAATSPQMPASAAQTPPAQTPPVQMPPVQTTPAQTPAVVLPGAKDLDRESYVSSGVESHPSSSPELPRTPGSLQTQQSRERYDHNDFSPAVEGREFNYGSFYDAPRSQSNENRVSATSYSNRAKDLNHSSLDHIRYLQQHSRPPRRDVVSEPAQTVPTSQRQESQFSNRKPVPGSRPPNQLPYPVTELPTASRVNGSRASLTAPIPAEPRQSPPQPLRPPPSVPPRPGYQPHAHQPPTVQLPEHVPPTRTATGNTTATGASSIYSTTRSLSSVSTATLPLILPTETALQGFCKGAFRLHIGLMKKAFSVANRPAGLAGMVSYWKCEKCDFEGPMFTTVTSAEKKKKGKVEKCFDPKVRTSPSGGVRYKWAFLAKSHVSLKGVAGGMMTMGVEGREGSFGSFGCLFCCAEGQRRGWSAAANANSEAMSVRSGRSQSNAGGPGQGAPTFGNVTSFMEHLEMHRAEDGWPNAEMQGRAKCIVGRAADLTEEWDVNFLPV